MICCNEFGKSTIQWGCTDSNGSFQMEKYYRQYRTSNGNDKNGVYKLNNPLYDYHARNLIMLKRKLEETFTNLTLWVNEPLIVVT